MFRANIYVWVNGGGDELLARLNDEKIQMASIGDLFPKDNLIAMMDTGGAKDQVQN